MLPTFLTIDEADAILEVDAIWDTSDDVVKQDALEMARLYTETTYSSRISTELEIPYSVKVANALFAKENIKKDIFSRQDGLGDLEEKKIVADGVEVTKKYKNGIAKNWKDPFPKATAMLYPYFVLKTKTKSIRTVQAIRG